MKRLMMAVAAAALFAGCGKDEKKPSEAELFGYRKGDGDYEAYFTVGLNGAVTNYLPGRCLGVQHDYDFTADELALLRDADLVRPGAPRTAMPEGYRKRTVEPWFTTWECDAERFGEKGMGGCIAHYDPDTKEHQVGEVFFSTYWKTREEALAAQQRLRERIDKTYHPKKFWAWPDSHAWLAEYVRLRVMALVGYREDKGDWSCMIAFNDKCNREYEDYTGVIDQQEFLDDWQYGKDLRAWEDLRRKTNDAKHAAVLKICRERGYAVPEKGESWGDGPLGTTFYYSEGGEIDTNATTVADFVAAKLDAFSKRTGVAFAAGLVAEKSDDPFAVRSVARATNDLYKVAFTLVVFKPQPPAPLPEPPEGEAGAQGASAAATDAAGTVRACEPPPVPKPYWECAIDELPLKGFELPPRPEYPKPRPR